MAETVVERLAVRARHIQHPETDRFSPRLGAGVDPTADLDGGPPLDHLDQFRVTPRTADINDRGGPLLVVPFPQTDEQRFVQPQCLNLADPPGVRLQQRLTVRDDRVVHGVAITPQFRCHIADRSTQTANLDRRPPPGAVSQRGTAILASCTVHDLVGQSVSRQHHRCLRHTSRAGRPKHGRSTSTTSSRSLIEPRVPQRRHHACSSSLDSTFTMIGPPGRSSTPRTFTSPKPTSSSHMRVGLHSTGALHHRRR